MSIIGKLKNEMIEIITQLDKEAEVAELHQIMLDFFRERGYFVEPIKRKYEPLYGALDDSEPAEAWIARIRSSRIFNQNP